MAEQLILDKTVLVPIGSMYWIFTSMYNSNQPQVGKYTIHGSYGVTMGNLFQTQVPYIFHPFFFGGYTYHFSVYQRATSVFAGGKRVDFPATNVRWRGYTP